MQFSDSLYWNQTPESKLINDVEINDGLLPVKTEAQDSQVSGCLFEEPNKTDPAMADPFFEEYLDLGGLFPELIPSFDTFDMLPCFNEEIPAKEGKPMDAPLIELQPSDVEPTVEPPSPDIMEEIDNLLAEAELGNMETSAVEELLNVEVVDEAPIDQEQSELYYSCVSSPVSVISSSDSCTTTVTDNVNIDAELQHLLELLDKTDTQELETIEATDLHLESSPRPPKRKLKTEETQVAKKQKHSPLQSGSNVDKATARRIKNNEASKTCRASRKQREQSLFAKEEELLKSNAELKAQVEELTKETEALRRVLIQRLSGVTTVG